MIVQKARLLGRIYFFLVIFAFSIPFACSIAYYSVIPFVADSYVTIDYEGDSHTDYQLNTITEEGWVMIRQEQFRFVDIMGAMTLFFSVFWGASTGEDVIFNNRRPKNSWQSPSAITFCSSFLVGSLIWEAIFIYNTTVFQHYSILYVTKLILGCIATALVSAIFFSTIFGERMIYWFLRFHKKPSMNSNRNP